MVTLAKSKVKPFPLLLAAVLPILTKKLEFNCKSKYGKDIYSSDIISETGIWQTAALSVSNCMRMCAAATGPEKTPDKLSRNLSVSNKETLGQPITIIKETLAGRKVTRHLSLLKIANWVKDF